MNLLLCIHKLFFYLRKIFFYYTFDYCFQLIVFYLKNNNYLYADLHSLFLLPIILLIGHFLHILGEPPICSHVIYMISFYRISSIFFSTAVKILSSLLYFFISFFHIPCYLFIKFTFTLRIFLLCIREVMTCTLFPNNLSFILKYAIFRYLSLAVYYCPLLQQHVPQMVTKNIVEASILYYVYLQMIEAPAQT